MFFPDYLCTVVEDKFCSLVGAGAVHPSLEVAGTRLDTALSYVV